jgi:hypothetical protein
LNFYVKDNDEIIAGINCCFYFGEFLYVNVLFVKGEYRKALIVAAGITDSNAAEAAEPMRIIDEIIANHRLER